MVYICTRNTVIVEWFFKIMKCENSSAGRARPCQGRGRGFEPRFSLNTITFESKVFLIYFKINFA